MNLSKRKRIAKSYLAKWLIALLVLSTLSTNVYSLDYTYSIYTTLTYNDNFNPNLPDPSGYSSDSGLSLDINSDQNLNWVFRLSGDYGKQFYSIKQLESQETKNLNLRLDYSSSKSNFGLLVMENIAQAPQNRVSTQSVNNITDVKVTTVRPSYFLRFSPTDQIVFDSTYTKSVRKNQSSITPDGLSFNSRSILSSIRYDRKINSSNDISFVISSDDINLSSNTPSIITPIDYVQDNAFVSWVGQGAYNQLQLDLGISKIKDQLGRDFDTELINIVYQRNITDSQSLIASYNKGFFVSQRNNALNNSINVSTDSFSQAQETISSSLNYTASSTYLNFSVNLSKSKFSNTGNSSGQDSKAMNILLSYSLAELFATSLTTNVSLSFRRNESEFIGTNNLIINTEVNSTIFRFNYAHNQTTTYFASFNSRKTDGNNQNALLNGGDSKSINIGFIYTPRTIE